MPLDGATAGRDYVRVAFGAEQVKETAGVESEETLSSEALERVRGTYGIDLPGGAALEAATLLERRRGEAHAAVTHADELEREALAAAEAAKDSRGRAEEAARGADDAERAAVDTHDRALSARQAADAARRDAGLGDSTQT